MDTNSNPPKTSHPIEGKAKAYINPDRLAKQIDRANNRVLKKKNELAKANALLKEKKRAQAKQQQTALKRKQTKAAFRLVAAVKELTQKPSNFGSLVEILYEHTENAKLGLDDFEVLGIPIDHLLEKIKQEEALFEKNQKTQVIENCFEKNQNERQEEEAQTISLHNQNTSV